MMDVVTRSCFNSISLFISSRSPILLLSALSTVAEKENKQNLALLVRHIDTERMNAIASSSSLVLRLSCTCRLVPPTSTARNFSSIKFPVPFPRLPSLLARPTTRSVSALAIRDGGSGGGRDGKGKGRSREETLRMELERTVQAGLLSGHSSAGSGGLKMRCTTLNREGSSPFVLAFLDSHAHSAVRECHDD